MASSELLPLLLTSSIAILGDVMIEDPVVSATLKVESLWVGGLIRDLRILRLDKRENLKKLKSFFS